MGLLYGGEVPNAWRTGYKGGEGAGKVRERFIRYLIKHKAWWALSPPGNPMVNIVTRKVVKRSVWYE